MFDKYLPFHSKIERENCVVIHRIVGNGILIVNGIAEYDDQMYEILFQDIQQLELLCKQMYQAQDSSIRSEAEKALVAFQDSCDALPKCQLLLDRGDSSYSQLLAATTLTKLISKNVQGLSLQQRIDIR